MKREGHFQLRSCYLQLHLQLNLQLGSLLPKQLHLDTQAGRAGLKHDLLLAQVPNWKAEMGRMFIDLFTEKMEYSIKELMITSRGLALSLGLQSGLIPIPCNPNRLAGKAQTRICKATRLSDSTFRSNLKICACTNVSCLVP